MRQYAKHRGVSAMAVSKAVKAGRISLTPDKLIDPEVADAEWTKNTRVNPFEHQKTKSPEPELVAPKLGPDGRPLSMADAQLQTEIEKHRKLKAENDRIEGKTLDAEDVRRTWERHRESVKNRLLLTPSKVPPSCREQVEKEIRAALEELGEQADVA